MKAQYDSGPVGCRSAPRRFSHVRLLLLALLAGLGLAGLTACGDSTPTPGVLPTALVGSTPPGGPNPAHPPPIPPTLAVNSVPRPPAPTALATGVAPQEASTIYNLIAHDLVAQSQGAPGAAPPPYIGINPQAGKGPLLDTSAADVEISDDLIDNMADLGTTVAFSGFMDAIGSLENGGQVRDRGIYLTIGVLEPAGDNVQAYASYYRASNDATGYRYTLERAGGGPWVIKDRQQVWDH